MSRIRAGTEGDDPLIDEIRTIRKAISDEFDNDVDRLCDHLREIERIHPGQIIQEETVIAGDG